MRLGTKVAYKQDRIAIITGTNLIKTSPSRWNRSDQFFTYQKLVTHWSYVWDSDLGLKTCLRIGTKLGITFWTWNFWEDLGRVVDKLFEDTKVQCRTLADYHHSHRQIDNTFYRSNVRYLLCAYDMYHSFSVSRESLMHLTLSSGLIIAYCTFMWYTVGLSSLVPSASK